MVAVQWRDQKVPSGSLDRRQEGRQDERRSRCPRDVARHLQPAGPGTIGSVPHPNIGRSQEVPLMDVQPLAISIGFPGQRKTRAKPASPASSRPIRSRRRRGCVDRQPPSVASRLHDALDHRRPHRAGLDDPARPDQPDHRSGPQRHGPGRTVGRDAALDRVRDDRIPAHPARPRRSLGLDVPFPVRRRGDGPWRPDRRRLGRLRLHHRTSRAQ